VLTPHWTGAPGEPETVGCRIQELQQRLSDEEIPLRLHRGNEVILIPSLVQALEERRAFTLGGSSYLLLETAQLEHGAYTHSALFQIQSSGYRIVLAHPERVRAWQSNQSDLLQLLWRGCYLQVNAGSLLGSFGVPARKAAELFVRLGWVSLLASDAHSPESRPPLLSEALRRCAKLIGAPAAQALVEDNPMRVLCNEMLPPVDPDSIHNRRPAWLPRWPFGSRS
jgi:protein-tyrosine phosphatase